MPDSVRVFAFDLDDTLAVSKQQIDPVMAGLLARLLERVDVCVISGGRFEQFSDDHLSAGGSQRRRPVVLAADHGANRKAAIEE